MDPLSYFGLPSLVLEIGLRLPPLYLMDLILLRDWGLKPFEDPGAVDEHGRSIYLHTVVLDNAGPDNATPIGANGTYSLGTNETALLLSHLSDWTVVPYLVNFFLCLLVYVGCLFLITLSPRQLGLFYAYVVSALCLPTSYASHKLMIEARELELQGLADEGLEPQSSPFLSTPLTTLPWLGALSLSTQTMLCNYVIQTSLGLVLGNVLKFHFSTFDVLVRVLTLSMVSPNFFATLGLEPQYLHWTNAFSLVLPILLTSSALWTVMGRAIRVVFTMIQHKRQFVVNFGLNTFLETEWARLKVPCLLRTFWLTRMGMKLAYELFKLTHSNIWQSEYAYSIAYEHLQWLAKDMVSGGAETLIAVLGMTAIISSVCHYIGSFFHMLLNADEEEEKSVASISAVLFFVLALQTGLTSLESEKRFTRLCKNLCLLLTALFHFIHNMVSPVLMSLSASHNYNSAKHLRALLICVFLVLAPIFLMTYLWTSFSVGTWLLAVSAFCIEVIVKVSVTVCVYMLFLYDQFYQEGTWESLDDAVYYVKAVGNSVEFCFAVFLFFNGGWILVFESGGTIRALMMLIHAYCNIWCEAKAGWQTFMKRRTAVTKINSLPDASKEQLEENNDVCAICYQDMTSAKLTRCNHFFHGVCLRKWLYVQDTCPLCHATLYKHLLGKQQQKQQPDAGERVPGDVAASPAEQQQNLPPAQPQRAANGSDPANVQQHQIHDRDSSLGEQQPGDVGAQAASPLLLPDSQRDELYRQQQLPQSQQAPNRDSLDMDEIIDNDLSDSSEDDDDEDHEDEVEHDEGDEDDDDTSSGYDADVNVDSAEEEDSDSMVELGYESDGVRTDTDFIYDGLEEEYSDEEDANNVHVLHPLL